MLVKDCRTFLVVPALVLALACSGGPRGKAKEFMRAGMYEQAKVVLIEAIENDPSDARLHFDLGRCLLALNELQQAQQSFDRAIRLRPRVGSDVGDAYFERARELLDDDLQRAIHYVDLAHHYEPALGPEMANELVARTIEAAQESSFPIALQLASAVTRVDPDSGGRIAQGLLSYAEDQPPGSLPALDELASMSSALDPSTRQGWSTIHLEWLRAAAGHSETADLLALGGTAVGYDAAARDEVVGIYKQETSRALAASPLEATVVRDLVTAATALDRTVAPELQELTWTTLRHHLLELGDLGRENFLTLYDLCQTLGTPEAVRESPEGRYATAIKLWEAGSRQRSLEILEEMATQGDGELRQAARSLLDPPSEGRRTFQMEPYHFSTWAYGPGGGKGVDIEFTALEVKAEEIELSFSVRSGDHTDILLYGRENGGGCERLYLLDDIGKKTYTTSNFLGGRQKRFNSCANKITINPGEEVLLTARFPMVSRGATSFKFVSPNPDNAGHQTEWWWSGIVIKAGPFAER